MSTRKIIHLLPNSHLDPVWLWDWREGLNEGLVTVRTILDLMEERPHLTYMRGEAAIYEHIEKTDPRTFERIGRMVEAGRWDVVGGTYIQPDSNLPSTETLCRQFERGLKYFESRFGRRPTIAWQADSFGHTPGWPNILRSFGMEGFTFTRPQREQFPLESPVFWWQTDYDDRLLCYRQHWKWYCSERFNLIEMLDATLAGARTQPFRNVGLLMGLGNHGGGPTRRHLEETEQWAAAHPDVEVRFSTLHGFFDQVKSELGTVGPDAVPTVKGDVGYCLRGCYSSVAKFKYAYRRAEALVADAETTQALVSQLPGGKVRSLDEAWDAILFNAFHDVLPGSSIERAFEDQLAWMGAATHQAQVARFEALNRLATLVDTRVPPATKPDRATDIPILVWNPLPRPVTRWFEVEAQMDYRHIKGYTTAVGTLPLSLLGPAGDKVKIQDIPTEHMSMRDQAWRKRVAVYDELPAFGWKLYHYGYREDETVKSPQSPAVTAIRKPRPELESREWRVTVTPEGAVRIQHHGADLFPAPHVLGVRLVEDHWGSWGGMNEERDANCLETIRETWHITRSEVLEQGPFRGALWTRWQGTNSWVELTFYVADKAPGVRVQGRLLMNDRSARVKLVLPGAGPLDMEVPASCVTRGEAGQLPAGRWVSYGAGKNRVGFVSDVLGDVDATDTEVCVTLARASRYADDVRTAPEETPWLPAVDAGELKFEFWLTGGETSLPALTDELLHPPVALLVPPHAGSLARTGSCGTLKPESVRLLSAWVGEDGKLCLRIQNLDRASIEAEFWREGKRHSLGVLRPGEITTVKVT